MRRRVAFLAGLGVAAAAGLLFAPAVGRTAGPRVNAVQAGDPAAKMRVARGEYLVRSGGCTDCHTPKVLDKTLNMPVDDETRKFAGHPAGAPDPQGTLGPGDSLLVSGTFTAFKLPFGTVYAANLTSDAKTGIGSWTEDLFIKTMRTGRHLGVGRAVLPPMPWPGVGAMTDEDLRAVFAYFQSLPAVSNQVPAPKVPEPVLADMARANAAVASQLASGQAPPVPTPGKGR